VAVAEGTPEGPPPRWFRGVLEYDGTDFHGWQVQGSLRTVQGELEAALAGILGGRVPVIASGRTDAGVHAEGQLVSFRAATRLPPERLAAALNARLPSDLSVLSLEEAPEGFHATRDAVSKVYRYSILNGRTPRPLLRRTTWRVPQPLDLARMRRGAAHLVGRHDFASFRTHPGAEAEDRGTVRTVHRIDVSRKGPVVSLEVEGDGFLYNMVRAITGTLVAVGRGHWEPDRVAGILRARDRAAAGPTAPARGLCLVSVVPGDPPPPRSAGGRRKQKIVHARPRKPRMEGRRRSSKGRPSRGGEAMNVRFTGRHVGISEEDRSWAGRKAEALARFHPKVGDIEVRVVMDGAMLEQVELETSLGRQHRAVSKGEAEEFRAAFDLAAEGLRRQLQKDKEKVVDRRRRSSSREKRKPGESSR